MGLTDFPTWYPPKSILLITSSNIIGGRERMSGKYILILYPGIKTKIKKNGLTSERDILIIIKKEEYGIRYNYKRWESADP